MQETSSSIYYDRISEAANLSDSAACALACRKILESLFKELTADARYPFDGLYARTQYVFKESQVDREIVAQTHRLRIYCNKVVHDDIVGTEKESQSCIKALTTLVEYFFKCPIPHDLVVFCQKVTAQPFKETLGKSKDHISEDKVLLLNIGPIGKNEKDDEFFTVDAKSVDGNLGENEFKIEFFNTSNYDFTNLQNFLKPYQTLAIYNFRKHPHKSDLYFTDEITQIVLEPDILVDISEIAECFSNKSCQPLLYLLKKLLPQKSNSAMFKGNVVNALLDKALLDESTNLAQSFRKAVSAQTFHAITYGRETLNSIYEDIRNQHWPNLQDFAKDMKSKNYSIEPTFFSSKYGLQGRLDLLVNDSDKKHIYELKSGSSPGFSVWKNNEMQVVGYNLLLQSTYGLEKCGTSAIIYSAAKKNPVRNVTSDFKASCRFLSVRNTVISWLLQIADNDFSVLNMIPPEAPEGSPSFINSMFSQFHNNYNFSSQDAKEYYHSYLSFVIREWLNAKIGMYGSSSREDSTGGFSTLWKNSKEQKEADFNIISELEYESYNNETGVLRLGRHTNQKKQHNFRQNDTVLVYPYSEDTEPKPLDQQIFKGRLDLLAIDCVSVSLNNRQKNIDDIVTKDSRWILEHDFYEANYWTTIKSLFDVLSPKNSEKLSLLLGNRPPTASITNNLEFPELNENINSILNAAITSNDYYLIQGPPGTGKTSTILPNIVKNFEDKGIGSIVVVAFTNRAVDEISSKLKDAEISFLQMGSHSSGPEKYLQQLCEKGSLPEASDYINDHHVFLSTVATMASRYELLQEIKKDLNILIVDEASQLTDPQIIGLGLQFSKVILIGDQNQLPPVVAQDKTFYTNVSSHLQSYGINDLSKSLFERLMATSKKNAWNYAWGMLTTHYRMHEQIADLINPCYDGNLKPGTDQQKQSFKMLDPKDNSVWSNILTSGRLVFIPSPTEKSYKFHQRESECIVELLKCIRETKGKDFDPTKTVGVITPWRTQIANIRNLLDDNFKEVSIETVERFQGSENDIILVTLAVYHPRQLSMLRSPGIFPTDKKDIELDRKLLVTLSRAKSQIIFLGDEKVIRSSRHYSAAVDKMHRFEMPTVMMA